MTAVDIAVLRDIIRISLTPLGWWSHDAEELLLMTAAHETGCGGIGLVQLGGGPALGIYQIEGRTLFDNYQAYLNYPGRRELADKIARITGVSGPDLGHLQYNLLYGTIHARLRYRRGSVHPLPPASDPWRMAEYAKDVYNTEAGAATPADYYHAYRKIVLA
jgi:hypothetical protein